MTDYSVFVKMTSKVCVLLIVYVDDIVLFGNDSIGLEATKEWLKSKLHIKDLGQLHHSSY